MDIDTLGPLDDLLDRACRNARHTSLADACRDLFRATIERELRAFRGQLPLFLDSHQPAQRSGQARALVDAALGMVNVGTYVLRNVAHGSDLWHAAVHVLDEAGQFLEIAQRFLSGRREDAPTGLALDVALAYQVSGHLPKSYVTAQRFLEQLQRRPTSPIGTFRCFHSDVRRAVACFLSRDWPALGRVVTDRVFAPRDQLAARMNRALRSGSASLWHVSRFVGNYDLAVALRRFSEFLRTGDAQAALDARRLIASAVDILSQVHSPADLWIASQVQLAMQQAERSSIWHQLSDWASIPRSYLELLADGDTRHPIYELWPPQVQALTALHRPIASGRHAEAKASITHSVIALPTGAGKSLIAELAIVEHISGTAAKQCAYVVPTRSLARQASQDLAVRLQRLDLRVVSLEDAPSARLQHTRVFVCTPEKLNSLLGQVGSGTSTPKQRLDPSNLRLIVIDEAHLLGDQGQRGLLLEMLVLRVRKLCPSASILLLSAVTSNAALLGRWLNGSQDADHEHCLSADWSPSGLVYAVLRPDNTLEYENGASFAVPKLTGCTSRPVRLVVQYCLPRQLKTLVFVNTQKRAGKIAKAIASHRPSPQRGQSEPLTTLINTVRDEFAAIGVRSPASEEEAAGMTSDRHELPLIQCLRKRVAFHHAALPSRVRTAVEEGVHDGEIEVVVATTTLAEGLNFPMNCVVLGDLGFWSADSREQTPMSRMLCRNIVGRAGRPFEDTQGEAIIVAPQRRIDGDPDATRVSGVERGKSYWVRQNSEVEPVRSSLRALCAEVCAASEDTLVGEMALVYQRQLLAALQEGVVDAGDPRPFLKQTLLAYEPGADRLLAELLKHTRAQLEYIQGAVDAGNLATFRRTGLSAAACLDMQQRIQTNLACDREFYRIYQVGRRRYEAPEAADARGRELLDMAFVPSRPKRVLDPVGILSDWISGDSVATIAERRFGADGDVDHVLSCSYRIEREIKPNAAWALSGFRILLDDWKERKDNSVEYTSTVSLMPRYVEYGVNHPVAVYMLDMGALERRDDALTAAYAFDRTEQLTYDTIADFHFVLEWMKRTHHRSFAEYTDGRNAERILSRLREYGRTLPEERIDAANQEYL